MKHLQPVIVKFEFPYDEVEKSCQKYIDRQMDKVIGLDDFLFGGGTLNKVVDDGKYDISILHGYDGLVWVTKRKWNGGEEEHRYFDNPIEALMCVNKEYPPTAIESD